MKTIILASLAAAAVGAPALAHDNLRPQYSATYDARRDAYCIKAENYFALAETPSANVRRCRSAEQWSAYGLHVTRRPSATMEVAQR